MNNITNILIVGVGGQGIITASDIIAQAALNEGYDTKKSEIHGMSQRGGSVFSHIRFGDKVQSPLIPAHGADILISLERMETLRWIDYAGAQTQIIMSQTQILPANVETYPEGIEDILKNQFPNVHSLDLKRLKTTIENPKTINVILLGFVSKFIDISIKSWQYAMENLVPEGTYEANLKTFETGSLLS